MCAKRVWLALPVAVLQVSVWRFLVKMKPPSDPTDVRLCFHNPTQDPLVAILPPGDVTPWDWTRGGRNVAALSLLGRVCDAWRMSRRDRSLEGYLGACFNEISIVSVTHNIHIYIYMCMYIRILYTCIISVYMIETRDLSCSSESHTKMQAVTQSIMFTNSSVSTISYKKQNTDRCLSCSGEEVQVKVSE